LSILLLLAWLAIKWAKGTLIIIKMHRLTGINLKSERTSMEFTENIDFSQKKLLQLEISK
jgi:hypothetical protein